MSTHRIRTTVVGSYPIPEWLAAMPTQQAVVDATKVVFQTQELAGVDVVADGELYRFDPDHPDTNGMIDYFVRPMSGIREKLTRSEIEDFLRRPDMAFRPEPAGVVEGAIGEGTLNIPRDFRRSRACTHSPMKFTLTGPHMLSKTLVDRHYGSVTELAWVLGRVLAAQVAEIDPEVIQIDEANITGHPDEGHWAADAINLVLDAATKAKEKGVHLCFGNYGGQSIQKGHWKQLVEFMNRLKCDHVVLELAFRGYDELEHIKRELEPRIGIGLGVIDVKVNTVETPEIVARRIEQGAKILGAERIKWVHPDCGFWMLKRSVTDRKIVALVKGRDLYLQAGR